MNNSQKRYRCKDCRSINTHVESRTYNGEAEDWVVCKDCEMMYLLKYADEDDGVTLGERIKDARKKKGLTQDDLAKMLGITFAMIGQYERGERNPKRETLQRIADALGVNIGELFGQSDKCNYGAVLRNAIETYGEESQIDMMIEECSELIRALCKWKRYRDAARDLVEEEMADVKIMLQQMEMIFGNIDDHVDAKIVRLEKRLAEE